MSEFRRIMMSSFLMLLLHFTAAKLKSSLLTVRAGDEVTLPCDNEIHDQDNCESISWYFGSSSSTAVELVHRGQISKEAKAKSDRLSVTEKCSLGIKKVTEEDAGRFYCQQFKESVGKQSSDSQVHLSVVTVTEHQDNEEVTLRCSVTRRGRCEHRVKWLLQGRDVVKDHREIKTSQSFCSASVTFLTSLFSYTTRSELFTCEVTDKFTGEEHLFPFSPQSSVEDTKPGTTTTKTTTTAKPNLNSGDDTRKVTTVSPTTTKSTLKVRPALETTNTASENNQTEQEDKNPGWWWWIIVVIVGVAALTIITVAVIRRKRTQGTRTETNDDVADPEDGVSYASISYTRKTSRKARADDDEDDAVTYSTATYRPRGSVALKLAGGRVWRATNHINLPPRTHKDTV